jgi:chemotaxis protein MotB
MSGKNNQLTEKPVEAGAPKWVVTFGDLMSLLLCFFVLLLSFSETDKAIYKEVAGSMKEAFGVQKTQKVLDSLMGQKIIAKDFDQKVVPTLEREEVIATQMKEEIGEALKDGKNDTTDMEHLIEVSVDKGQVSIRLMGESTFDSGSADIRPEMVTVLEKIVSVLNKTNGDITIAGHTDNVPIKNGHYKSNLLLSMARAAAVADFLISKTSIKPERISTMGYGEFRPRETNLTEAGRQKNRRVEIILKVTD